MQKISPASTRIAVIYVDPPIKARLVKAAQDRKMKLAEYLSAIAIEPAGHAEGTEPLDATLRAWQASMGYTQAQAAAALGVGLRTYGRYAAIGAPRVVELACKALAAGLA